MMKGRLSLSAGIAGNDAHNLIMIEGLADEGGDQPRLEGPFNGRIVRVEITGNDDDRQFGVGVGGDPVEGHLQRGGAVLELRKVRWAVRWARGLGIAARDQKQDQQWRILKMHPIPFQVLFPQDHLCRAVGGTVAAGKVEEVHPGGVHPLGCQTLLILVTDTING